MSVISIPYTETRGTEWLTAPRIMHGLLWLIILFNDWIDFQFAESITAQDIGLNAVRYLLSASIVYLILLVLAPRLLDQGRYLAFGLAAGSALLAGAWLYLQYHEHYYLSCGPFLVFRGALSTFSFHSLLFLGLRYYAHYQRQERQRHELEQEHTRQQLRQLKGQLNPHFLFNTMNNFYALAQEKSGKLPGLILQHAELLRYSIYETEANQVPLEREIDFLINYVELERIRLEDSVDIQLDINGLVNGQQIAPLLLVPFVENAFKYGSRAGDRAFVHIVLDVEPGALRIRLVNSRDHHRVTRFQGGGLGLRNVRQRLELLYPGQHELSIREKADTFTVELKLEL